MIGWNQTLGLGALLFSATSHRRTVSKEETLAGLLQQQHPPPLTPRGHTGGGPEWPRESGPPVEGTGWGPKSERCSGRGAGGTEGRARGANANAGKGGTEKGRDNEDECGGETTGRR